MSSAVAPSSRSATRAKYRSAGSAPGPACMSSGRHHPSLDTSVPDLVRRAACAERGFLGLDLLRGTVQPSHFEQVRIAVGSLEVLDHVTALVPLALPHQDAVFVRRITDQATIVIPFA